MITVSTVCLIGSGKQSTDSVVDSDFSAAIGKHIYHSYQESLSSRESKHLKNIIKAKTHLPTVSTHFTSQFKYKIIDFLLKDFDRSNDWV